LSEDVSVALRCRSCAGRSGALRVAASATLILRPSIPIHMSGESALGAIRRPEHTGDRRCWPCTVVNVALLSVLAGVLAVAVSVVLASVVAVLGVGAIWLRGYFVPGTPAFAPRLVAAIPGGEALFDKPATDSTSGDGPERPEQAGSLDEAAETPDGEQLLGALVEVGVLEVDGEQVVLAPNFETDWQEAMGSLSALSTDDLAAEVREVAAAADTRVVRDDGAEWIALGDGHNIAEEVWLTRPVAIAETAAVRRLPDVLDDPSARRAAASSLRMFLAECPDCSTPLEESTVMDCCGGYNGPSDVPEETLVCPNCDARLYTFDD
jgi:hypothetical protein